MPTLRQKTIRLAATTNPALRASLLQVLSLTANDCDEQFDSLLEKAKAKRPPGYTNIFTKWLQDEFHK